MIDAADCKQYIFPLLFFKRVSDLWDELYQTALDESDGDLTFAEFAENHCFQIPKGCQWEDVRKRTVDVGAYLQKALNGIEKANFEMLHHVFGDAQWTNKRRMSDKKMLDLIEHFSKMNLSVANVPHDIMGEGYEYLIKKFADDSGHTANTQADIGKKALYFDPGQTHIFLTTVACPARLVSLKGIPDAIHVQIYCL